MLSGMPLGFYFMVISMSLYSGGGSNDLASFIDAQTYWRTKGATISVKAMAAELEEDPDIKEVSKYHSLAKLMAIRALGELKDKEALPILRNCLKSKERFVADYAAEAIAAIEGKAPPARAKIPLAVRLKDLALMPADCAMVVQTTKFFSPMGEKRRPLVKIILSPGMKAEPLIAELSRTFINVVERVGNIRIDLVTIGTSREMGVGKGFIIAAARGLFDSAAISAALERKFKKTSTVNGQKVIYLADNITMMLFNDNLAVITILGSEKDLSALKETIAAFKTGKSGLQTSAELAKLVKSVGVENDFWLAAEISDSYRQHPVFAPFKNMTIVGNMKKGVIPLKLVAEAADPETIAKTLETMEITRKQLFRAMRGAAVTDTQFQPAVDLLKTTKMENKDGKITMSATLTGSLSLVIPKLFLGAPPPQGPPPETAPAAGRPSSAPAR